MRHWVLQWKKQHLCEPLMAPSSKTSQASLVDGLSITACCMALLCTPIWTRFLLLYHNYLSLTSWMRRSQQWKSSLQLQLWRITSHRAVMEFQRICWSVAGQCWSGGFTACFEAVGRTNASLANSRMPTSSLSIKTRVTSRTATTIEASRSLAFREKALTVQSSQDCSTFLTRCCLRVSAASVLVARPWTWFSQYASFRKSVWISNTHCTWCLSIWLRLSIMWVTLISSTFCSDSVVRQPFWQYSMASMMGCGQPYSSMVLTNEFDVCCGVKQGCVLAPTLFGIYFSAVLRRAFPDLGGVLLHTRCDGNFFSQNQGEARPCAQVALRRPCCLRGSHWTRNSGDV